MKNSAEILKILTDTLKKEFLDIAITEVQGNYFSAVDITLDADKGQPEIFTIVVMKCEKTGDE